MKKKLVALSVLSLLIGTSNVSAQNDVVVDLSVLENLQRNSYEGLSTVNVPQPEVQTTVVETVSLANGNGQSASTLLDLPPLQPKFPVVKAQPKKKVVAQKVKAPKKKPAKKVAKKAENPFSENEVMECQKYLSEKKKPVEKKAVAAIESSKTETSSLRLETPVNLVSESSSSDVDRIIREYEESKKLENSVSDAKIQNNLALQEEKISEANDVSLEGLTAPAQTLTEPEATSDALPPVLEKALAEPEVSNVDLAPVSPETLAEPEKTTEVVPSQSDQVLSEPEATNVDLAPVSEQALTEPEKANLAPVSVEEEIKQALDAPLSENSENASDDVLANISQVGDSADKIVAEQVAVEAEKVSGPQDLVNVEQKAEAQVAEASRKAEENFPELSSQNLSSENSSATVQQEAAAPTDANAYASNLIKFDEGVTSLTEVDKVKINSIMSRFEDARANKIGIMAFNLDNGQDTFKRKRECLSRATEIRSYLLSKGYKEFKIKVISVDEKSERTNAVELVELK